MQITFTFRFPLKVVIVRDVQAASSSKRRVVMLDQIGDRKIAVIKAIRAVTYEGLREVKDIVDAVRIGHSSIAATDLSPAQARQLAADLREVGAAAHVEYVR